MAKIKKTKGFLFFASELKIKYAGVHLVVEFWQAKNLNSLKVIEKALKEAVVASGSNLLNLYLHQFKPKGVSGVAVVSESHISIHTWPEEKYAAIDIFTCGKTQPYRALEVLKKYLKPKEISITEVKRGVVNDNSE